MNNLVWVLGSELQSSKRPTSDLSADPSLSRERGRREREKELTPYLLTQWHNGLGIQFSGKYLPKVSKLGSNSSNTRKQLIKVKILYKLTFRMRVIYIYE